MTRINCGINVKYLTDEHLLAEHREIKRMRAFLKRSKQDSINNIPKSFSLGKGHINFFLDKFQFTFKRYEDIYQECLRRGFNVKNYEDSWYGLYDNSLLWKDYNPTSKDFKILFDRRSAKINESPKRDFRYDHHKITKESAINLLKRNKK